MRSTMWLTTVALLVFLAFAQGPSIAQDENRYEPLRRFSDVLDMVENHYVKDITRKELINDAVKGMLQQLDPHSTYLTEEDFKEMQESTSGKFEGIGIEISMENGRLTVVSPIEDTPAFKAGLKPGDLILQINDEPTQDMSLMDAVKRIRGPKGSDVILTILHKNADKAEDVTITRGTIPIVAVKDESLEDGVLYLRLTRFNENTTKSLREAISDYTKDHELKGIVLDLRNNPGGLLDQAVTVTDTFIKDGMIVYIQGRSKNQRKDYFAKNQKADVDTPMVVLINPGSASASEIVAGALQDHKRALIIGERSFGKGSVQTIIPLSDGTGIKLTTALYYTPNGRSIQAEGIEPDLLVPFVPSPEEDKDPRFVREQNLTGHLENANGKSKKKEANGKAEKMLDRDNQLRMALELVKKLPVLKQIK